MKKTFALFLALTAFALVSARAQEINPAEPAQDTVAVAEPAPVVEEPLPLYTDAPKEDKQIFNHIAAGIPINFPFLPNGIGVIEVATTLTPFLQFRLGYSQSILGLTSFSINDISTLVPSLAGQIPTTIDANGTEIHIGDSKFSFGTSLAGIDFLMDVFPGKKTGFHFTFGAFVNPGCPNNILLIKADLRQALTDAGFNPGEYHTVYFGLNDEDPTFRISPNKEGVLSLGLYNTLPVHPYLGIGFGRAIRPEKRVCVTFDMGVVYWGKPVLVGYDYSMKPNAGETIVGITPERAAASKDLQSLAEPLRIIQNIPVYPIMKLNIFIRII